MPISENDFKEVSHCGGQVTFHFKCDVDGQIIYNQRLQGSAPNPAAWVGIYVSKVNGEPICRFNMYGIGRPFDPPIPLNGLPIFLGSDSHAFWGFSCPRCDGYFRCNEHSTIVTCPYCSAQGQSSFFCTPHQKKFFQECVRMFNEVVEAGLKPGEEKDIILNFDNAVHVEEGSPRPEFYYAEVAQQTCFTCTKCGALTDILGRYGYCALCGWRSNADVLDQALNELRKKINEGQINLPDAVRAGVSEFSSCCRDLTRQIAQRIPMKEPRQQELVRQLFHDLSDEVIEIFKQRFDIDLAKGLDRDLKLVRKMLCRRHCHEHNGSVADEKYIADSEDNSVRLGALIREDKADVHSFLGSLHRIAINYITGFHEIFIPRLEPIIAFEEKGERMRING